MKPTKKTSNQQVFLNIELLDEAISQKKKASFIYNSYDFDMKLKPRRERIFVVDPYLLLSEHERYYLICRNQDYESVSPFRLDRMTEVRILDETADPAPKDAGFDKYVGKATAFYFGEEELFTFRCKKPMLDDVIDRFGGEIKLFNVTGETFDFTVKVVDKAATFFALEYLSRCEIISPEHGRERMRRYIESGMERYLV